MEFTIADFLGRHLTSLLLHPEGRNILSRLGSAPGFAWGLLRLDCFNRLFRQAAEARRRRLRVSPMPGAGILTG